MILDTHGTFKSILFGSRKASAFVIAFCSVTFLAFFTAAIVHFIYSDKIGVGLALILAPFILVGICLIPIIDMARAYVLVEGDDVSVVDYYFFTKRIRTLKKSDIAHAKVVQGHGSFRSGYGLGAYQSKYAEFENDKGEYLFKVLITNDVKSAFGDKVPKEIKFGFGF